MPDAIITAQTALISRRTRTGLAAGLIILLTVLAYLPAIRGGFIWDDDDYVTQNLTLRDVAGLKRIWTEVGATPQYYPLVHTTFWLEYQAGGLNPLGYHVVNVLLHALGAILLWRVLLQLALPGAWLAAAIFALHPVQVESVAWITERKNVLSGVFYFAAVWAYLRFWRNAEGRIKNAEDRSRAKAGASCHPSVSQSREWYFLALGLFICALLSKTVTCSLPAALLLVRWWKTGRVGGREILPLVPFFVIGIGLGWHTAHMEKYTVGAVGAEWALNLPERVLIAGRALWFYAAKLVWPANLMFIYPRWAINAAIWWQWVFPLAVMGVVSVLWGLRNRIGRGPLVGVLFFAGTLFPALGFVNTYPMRYSFVADHFQYLAGLGLIALSVAGLSCWVRERPMKLMILPVGLGLLTWQQAHIYRDLETLWRDTLAKNSACWMAWNNLGCTFMEQGRTAEAVKNYQRALQLKPDYVEALNGLASAQLQQGRFDDAFANVQHALRLEPHFAATLNTYGSLLLNQGRIDEAVEQFNAALKFAPNDPQVLNNLGAALAGRHQWVEAEQCYRRSLALDPANLTARYNLAAVLLQGSRTDDALAQFREVASSGHDDAKYHREFAKSLAMAGKISEAIEQYRATVRLAPNDAQSHYNLGVLLGLSGQTADAIGEYREAVQLDPASAEAHNNLGVALTLRGKLAEALPHFTRALKLNTNYAEAHNNIAYALIQLGRRQEAIEHLREALRLKPDYEQAKKQLRELGIPVMK